MTQHRPFITLAFALSTAACDKAKEEQAPVPPPSMSPPAAVSASAADESKSDVERGKYLVTIGGCNDCHTTKKMGPKGPEPDPSKLLAGYIAEEKLPPPPAASGPWMVTTTASLTAWSGPWGRTFAANLTPDDETGLGKWTEEQFKQTLRTGKHLGSDGSREILPPMPWFNYAEMTEGDLKAVFAYLRSIPPVKNAVPSPIPNVK